MNGRTGCTGLGLLAVAMILTGCAGSTAEAPPAESAPGPLVKAGEALYRQHCASCHGMSGAGDGPVAVAMATPPADLRRIAERRDGTFPSADLASWIDGRFAPAAHGPREMPVWGAQLHDDLVPSGYREERIRGSIAAIVDYLRALQATPERR